MVRQQFFYRIKNTENISKADDIGVNFVFYFKIGYVIVNQRTCQKQNSHRKIDKKRRNRPDK